MSNQFHITNSAKSLWDLHGAKSSLALFFLLWVYCPGAGATTAPVVSFSPSVDNFGNQAVGTTNWDKPVELYNTGNAALTISSLVLSGPNPGDFFWSSSDCGSSLPAGGQCTINIGFTPKASSTRTAVLTLTDNAAGSPQTLSLTGTGTISGPAATFSPSALTFTSRAVGSKSGVQTVTLNNAGSAALTVGSVAVTGANSSNFAQSNNCGSSVAAGAKCTVSVTFTPSASGARTATLTIANNATGSPQSVSLSGTGAATAATAATASLSAASVTFGSCPTDTACSSQTVTLKNTGNATLSISSVTLTGTNPTNFTENNTCNSSLAAGGSCNIVILFTPSATGSRTAALSIADNAAASPQTAALTGTGTHDVVLTWVASTSSGIEGYNVYRGTSPGGETATPVNSAPIIGTTYTDANVTAGATEYYVVTAVASNGISHSINSNEASATVPSP